MAKGITEIDVHRAADALVATGERPTVDRIRQHLGTGSPNTVTRWLDSWWQGLGTRLSAQQAKAALPNAPAEVTALASQLWEQALACAGLLLEADMQAERDALAASRAELAGQVSTWEGEVREHAKIAGEARGLLAATETRLTDLQRLVEQQAAQVSDLQQQRSALQQRSEQAESHAAELAARLDTTMAAAADERELLLQQFRGLEERTAGEVDRSRQEAKRSQTQGDAREREWRATETSWQRRLEQAGRDTAAAQREAAAEQARAQALEHQLSRLGDLAASVEAALARVKPTGTPPPRKKTSKTRGRKLS